MTCLGRTINYRKCRQKTRFLFCCKKHFWYTIKYCLKSFVELINKYKVLTAIGGITSFIYYFSHDLHIFSEVEHNSLGFEKIVSFTDNKKQNVLIIQYINGIIEEDKSFAINYQIKEEITQELGYDNVDIQICSEENNKPLKEPKPDSELIEVGKIIKASLVIQFGINRFLDKNTTLTKVKWILPNQNENIQVLNKKVGRVNVLSDILQGEIPYTQNKNISNFSIGLMHFDVHHYFEALNYFNRIIDVDSSNFYCLVKFKSALCHYFIGSSEEYLKALKDFEAALTCNNIHAQTYNNKGLIYFLQSINDSAESNYQKAISLKADLISSLNNYAVLLEKRCNNCKTLCVDCDSAVIFYHKAIEVTNNLHIQCSTPFYNIASLFEERGINNFNDLDSAIYYYNLAINLSNKDESIFLIAKNNLKKLLKLKTEKSNSNEIPDLFSIDSISNNPSLVKSTSSNALGKIDKLNKVDYDVDSVRLYSDTNLLYKKVHMLLQQQQFKNAIDLLSEAMIHKVDYSYCFYLRGVAQYWLKNYNHAIPDFIIAETSNSCGQYLLALGNCYYATNELSEAITNYDKAINSFKEPNHLEAPEVFYARGTAYFKIGKLEDAIHDFSVACKSKEFKERAIIMRGMSYFRLKKYLMAISDYNQLGDESLSKIHYNGFRAAIFYFRARYFFDRKDFNHAESNYGNCIRELENPRDTLSTNNRKLFKYLYPSITEFELLTPKLYLCYNELARTNIEQKADQSEMTCYKKAEKCYLESLKYENTFSPTYNELINLYRLMAPFSSLYSNEADKIIKMADSLKVKLK